MMSIIEDRRGEGISSPDSSAQRQTTERRRPQTAGWFDDPEAQHRLRYHDGDGWTTHVTHFGPTPCSGCG